MKKQPTKKPIEKYTGSKKLLKDIKSGKIKKKETVWLDERPINSSENEQANLEALKSKSNKRDGSSLNTNAYSPTSKPLGSDKDESLNRPSGTNAPDEFRQYKPKKKDIVYDRAEHLRNREKRLKKKRQFYLENKEEVKEKTHKYYLENKGKRYEWLKDNSYQFERHKIRNLTRLKYSKEKCVKCGVKKNLHFHHLEPMNVDNFIVLCEECHLKEHNRERVINGR